MPTKAAYRAFEDEPGLEFEFALAERLSMTVDRLREEMPNSEFVQWSVYVGREGQRQELAAASSKRR